MGIISSVVNTMGGIAAVIIVFVGLIIIMMLRSSSKMSMPNSSLRSHDFIARLYNPSINPDRERATSGYARHDSNDVYNTCNCDLSNGQQCHCQSSGDMKAKDLINRQLTKKTSKLTGGSGLVQKIRGGNNLPEVQLKSHLASGTGDDDDGGDYSEYVTRKSINPDLKEVHKQFIEERKMYSYQPAQPSDVIESNYSNFWGLSRHSFVPVDPNAKQQLGANNSDYLRNTWNLKFG